MGTVDTAVAAATVFKAVSRAAERYNSRCGVIVSSTTTACLRACNGGGVGAKNSRCGAMNDGVDSTTGRCRAKQGGDC